MTHNTLIRHAQMIWGNRLLHGDLLIEDDCIAEIASRITPPKGTSIVEAHGRVLLPGLIDDQVHFREPGHPDKGDFQSESRAAALGGVTTVLEMPNTKPPTTTPEALADKFARARGRFSSNYSFYLGATEDNLDSIRRAREAGACGVKVFMGASTGSLLVQDVDALQRIFEESPVLIATHCEDSRIINERRRGWDEQHDVPPPPEAHPLIRSAESCYASSSLAVRLARETSARLHVLHISTACELELFEEGELEHKQITAEACVHHLFFDDSDYPRLGHRLKWNPSVKSAADRGALLRAVNSGRIDVIATDHAPHTLEEKLRPYDEAPSGGPLLQHALCALLELCFEGSLSLQLVVERMCHAPARLFGIERRGFLEPGYFADLVLVDLRAPWEVTDDGCAYRVGWTPFAGRRFRSSVTDVWVNGQRVVDQGRPTETIAGRPLTFDRS